MKKLVEFNKKYDILNLLLIFVFILILYVLFYGKQGKYLIDFSREAFLPWQMLEGKLLYKDLFNVYGPLGYQINAIAFKIFGISLNTLYLMGFLSSIVISYFIYFISKLFTSKKIALSITGIVISYCVFSVSLFNFIMPYSYSAVYALLGLLVSIYTVLLYFKDKKKLNLMLSFLFAGFSFANKIEYLPYFAFLFVMLPFVIENKKDWKTYFTAATSFFVFPILSFSCLLIQGVTVKELFDSSIMIKKLVESPATKYFYQMYGLYFSKYYALMSLKFFAKIIATALPVFAGFYFLNWTNLKFVQNKQIKILFNIFIFLTIIPVIKFIMPDYEKSFYLFSWIGIFVVTMVLGFLIYEILNYTKSKKEGKLFEIALDKKMFLLLCISAVLVSLKGFCSISVECYGTFAIAVLIIPFYVFIAKYIPKLTKKINEAVWQKSLVNVSFIAIVIFVYLNFTTALVNSAELIRTEKGVIFAQSIFKGQNNLIKYIQNNTPEGSSVYVLPEGAIINFLTNRKGHGYYYYLIPGNVDVFGAQNIMKDFEQNPPDYFLVNTIPYLCYNTTSIHRYMPEVINFIEKNYKIEIYLEGDIDFILYKRKDI